MAIHLQGIGLVKSKKVEDVKIGDILLWNYGSESPVVGFGKETAKMKELIIVSSEDGQTYIRKMKKEREVAFK